jgi:putative colanic acid biosysnthesis UDP-glucose lipid carrier transferase
MIRSRQTSFFVLANSLGDLFILNMSYILAHMLSFYGTYNLRDDKYIQLWLYLNIIYIVAGRFSGTFENFRHTRFFELLTSLITLFFLEVMLAFSYIVVFKDFNQTFKLSREVILFTYGIAAVLTTVWRLGFIKIVRMYRARGVNTRKTVIVGAGPTGQEVQRMLFNKIEYGYHFAGFFDDEPEKYPEVKGQVLGKIDRLEAYCSQNNVEEIFCALPYKQEDKIREIMEFCDRTMVRLKIVPDFSRLLTYQLARVNIDNYGTIPVLTLREEPLENAVNRYIKRIFDFGFSLLIFILIFWWLFPVIALLIKLTSKGPVFFMQRRSGFKNAEFNAYKFRTMYVNNDADLKQAERNDPRITPIGRILRKTNLDELPQFINVLLGHMSVIGPRPHMLKHTEEYSKIIDKFMVRHLVKPGITGWAQVNGFRGETKDPKDMEARVRADVWYIENWSFFLDIRIVLMTIYNMLRGEEKAF